MALLPQYATKLPDKCVKERQCEVMCKALRLEKEKLLLQNDERLSRISDAKA